MTSRPYRAQLFTIASQNTALCDALEFIQTQNNYIPVEDRSEEDEKIQRFVNAILV
jgi:hypothetical protein